MTHLENRIDQRVVGAERAAIVFISASAEDARSLQELVNGDRWLIVNVPDLAGARAVIDKVRPRLVVCDTEIEGQGSWRDLIDAHDAHPGFTLVVASRHAEGAPWPQSLSSGCTDVLEKPFGAKDVERVIGLADRHV